MTLFIIIRLIYEVYFRFPHFRILKAGMKKWMNKNKEPLISYQIELKTRKSSDELIFDDLWIDNKKYKFNLSREDRKFAWSFGQKEILQLNIISEIQDENYDLDASVKGRLILSYRFRNKKKFYTVKNFKEIEELTLISY